MCFDSVQGAEVLACLRGRGKAVRGGSSCRQRVVTLRHWDDEFRPAARVRVEGQLSGRKALHARAGVDYEWDSDEDWEGWNAEPEEDLEGEELDEEDAHASSLEEGEDKFVVPDDLVVLEDDTVVRTGARVPRARESRVRVAQCSWGGPKARCLLLCFYLLHCVSGLGRFSLLSSHRLQRVSMALCSLCVNLHPRSGLCGVAAAERA